MYGCVKSAGTRIGYGYSGTDTGPVGGLRVAKMEYHAPEPGSHKVKERPTVQFKFAAVRRVLVSETFTKQATRI